MVWVVLPLGLIAIPKYNGITFIVSYNAQYLIHVCSVVGRRYSIGLVSKARLGYV